MRSSIPVLALALSLALGGCLTDDPVADADLASEEQAGYYFGPQAFQRTRSIPVCWMTPGYDHDKALVRGKITHQYEQNSYFYVRFTGWGDCAPSSLGVRIRIVDERPHHLRGSGIFAAQSGYTTQLNFDFEEWDSWGCGWWYDHDKCVQAIALHEFGHVLGLAHEQARTDTPDDCDEEYARDGGWTPYGPYDANSIMNYCNDEPWETGGALSVGDNVLLGRIYPYGARTLEYGSHGFEGWFWNHDLSGSFCTDATFCSAADLDGDGDDDLVSIDAAGAVRYQQSNQDGDEWPIPSEASITLSTDFCRGGRHCLFGDLDDDGRDDILAVDVTTGQLEVGKVVFGLEVRERYDFGVCGQPEHQCRLGDVDGDGLADLIVFTRGGTGDVLVARRTWAMQPRWTGRGWTFDKVFQFAAPTKFHDWFCVGGEQCEVGDFNGDHRDDIIAFTRQGPVWVAYSATDTFWGASVWHDFFCVGNEACRVGDFDGDGRDDILTLLPSGIQYTSMSQGYRFAAAVPLNSQHCRAPQSCQIGDIDGDGHDDIVAFTPKMSSGWQLTNFAIGAPRGFP